MQEHFHHGGDVLMAGLDDLSGLSDLNASNTWPHRQDAESAIKSFKGQCNC